MSSSVSGVDVRLDINSIQLIREFGGTQKQVQRAVNSTLRKTTKWMKRQVLRSIALDASVPQKVLNPRVKDRVFQKENYATVWLGLNPVGAHKVGRARQTKKGTRIGRKHFFESAFPAKIFGYEKVWRRVFRGAGSSKRGRGDGRFPVEVMLVQLGTVGEDTAKKINREAKHRFYRILRGELNYFINIKGRR